MGFRKRRSRARRASDWSYQGGLAVFPIQYVERRAVEQGNIGVVRRRPQTGIPRITDRRDPHRLARQSVKLMQYARTGQNRQPISIENRAFDVIAGTIQLNL